MIACKNFLCAATRWLHGVLSENKGMGQWGKWQPRRLVLALGKVGVQTQVVSNDEHPQYLVNYVANL